VYDPTEVETRPEVLRQVAPTYPASAERAGTEDVVVVKVLVGTDGQAADVQILRGSRKDPGFDAAAMAAVRQWVFAPARKGGQPVASWYNVGVPFQLKR
jgi:protein TonB